MRGTPDTIVFRPRGAYSAPGFVIAGGVVLTVVGVAAAFVAPWSLLVAVLGLWYLTTVRQRAVLTEHELAVQGRFTRRTVRLADVERVHEERSRTVWVAARGQRPFRVYFVPAGTPGPDIAGSEVFLTEVRRRAAAAGALLDADAGRTERAPSGTSYLFSL